MRNGEWPARSYRRYRHHPTPQVRRRGSPGVPGRNDDPMKQIRDYPMKQTTKDTAVITATGGVTAARLAIREARPRRLTSTLLWAAQIPLAALFGIVAVPKLTGSQQAA